MIKVKIYERLKTRENIFKEEMELQTVPKIKDTIKVGDQIFIVGSIEHDSEFINLYGVFMQEKHRKRFWD